MIAVLLFMTEDFTRPKNLQSVMDHYNHHCTKNATSEFDFQSEVFGRPQTKLDHNQINESTLKKSVYLRKKERKKAGNDGKDHTTENSRQFNGYLVFESTAHECRYKFPCYGGPTNCFLHTQ